MFTLIRTIGGGPKNRMTEDGFNLDLTYITSRIIAMAFPAQGFQSVYRNDLEEVVTFLESRHSNNYMIINVSNRKYDYSKFKGLIKDYFWPDHQTPQLHTLFLISRNVTEFLQKNQSNVVVFHCNHGKGRTGTSIISFMMFSGFYTDLESGIASYNSKRFSTSKYQINIPCQVRYLRYFEQILKQKKVDYERLKPLKLVRIESRGIKKKDQIYLRFIKVKQNEQIGHDVWIQGKETNVDMKSLFIGDIKIKIYTDRVLLGPKKIGYLNFHTYFSQNLKEYYQVKELTKQRPFVEYSKISFHSRNIKISSDYSDLEINLIFEESKDYQLKETKNHKELVEKIEKERNNFEFIEKVLKLRKNFEFKI